MIDTIEIRGKVKGNTYNEAYKNALDELNNWSYTVASRFNIYVNNYAYGGCGEVFIDWRYEAKVKLREGDK